MPCLLLRVSVMYLWRVCLQSARKSVASIWIAGEFLEAKREKDYTLNWAEQETDKEETITLTFHKQTTPAIKGAGRFV